MILPFKFLKYLQPTSAFLLKNKKGQSLFPKVESLPKELLEQLTPNLKYKSPLSKCYDLSWQALHKGYIGTADTYMVFEPLPLHDEYCFVNTYFNKSWAVYVLLLRLLGLHNPFMELSAFFSAFKEKRSLYLKEPLEYPEWQQYRSPSLVSCPLVTVIIPTLNRYPYLRDVLKDLELQDYKNFEVIVVDQSEPFQKDFYTPFSLDIQVIQQEEKALWLARNTAIKRSKAEYLLFFDDDSRINKDWISSHLKCLDFFNADISSGVSISKVGAKIPEHYAFFRISEQLDTGNVLIKKEVFKSIGLFDRQFEKQRMGDGEFGLRAYLGGYLNVSNPYAQRLHLKVGSGGLREMGSWDAFRTKKWFAPRPIPSVLYFFRGYFGSTAARYALLRTVPLSIMPYRFKKNKGLMVLGILLSLLFLPIVLFQVYRSWYLSSKKLEEGAVIEELITNNE